MPNTIKAGRIRGSAVDGLCERVCIQVMRVYDGCRQSFSNQNFTFSVSRIPPQAVPPYTFIEAYAGGQVGFENVSVVDTVGEKSRISGDAVISVTVTLRDSLGNTYGGVGTIRVSMEFALRVPENAAFPYRIEVWGALRSRMGSFLNNDTVSFASCATFVAKVIVPTDILVPSYGNCVYPECDSVENACDLLAELTLFPD